MCDVLITCAYVSCLNDVKRKGTGFKRLVMLVFKWLLPCCLWMKMHKRYEHGNIDAFLGMYVENVRFIAAFVILYQQASLL